MQSILKILTADIPEAGRHPVHAALKDAGASAFFDLLIPDVGQRPAGSADAHDKVSEQVHLALKAPEREPHVLLQSHLPTPEVTDDTEPVPSVSVTEAASPPDEEEPNLEGSSAPGVLQASAEGRVAVEQSASEAWPDFGSTQPPDSGRSQDGALHSTNDTAEVGALAAATGEDPSVPAAHSKVDVHARLASDPLPADGGGAKEQQVNRQEPRHGTPTVQTDPANAAPLAPENHAVPSLGTPLLPQRVDQANPAPPYGEKIDRASVPIAKPEGAVGQATSAVAVPHAATDATRNPSAVRRAERSEIRSEERRAEVSKPVSLPPTPPVTLPTGLLVAAQDDLRPAHVHEAASVAVDRLAELTTTTGQDLARATPENRGAPQPGVARPVINQIVHAIARAPGDGAIEIRLQPEELGRVRLSLTPTEAGVSVSITAERFETLDLLRRSIDLLEKDLIAQGFEDLSFSFGSERPGSETPLFTDEEPGGPGMASEPQESLHIDLSQHRPAALGGRLDIRV